jgi:hypothetical protein
MPHKYQNKGYVYNLSYTKKAQRATITLIKNNIKVFQCVIRNIENNSKAEQLLQILTLEEVINMYKLNMELV